MIMDKYDLLVIRVEKTVSYYKHLRDKYFKCFSSSQIILLSAYFDLSYYINIDKIPTGIIKSFVCGSFFGDYDFLNIKLNLNEYLEERHMQINNEIDILSRLVFAISLFEQVVFATDYNELKNIVIQYTSQYDTIKSLVAEKLYSVDNSQEQKTIDTVMKKYDNNPFDILNFHINIFNTRSENLSSVESKIDNNAKELASHFNFAVFTTFYYLYSQLFQPNPLMFKSFSRRKGEWLVFYQKVLSLSANTNHNFISMKYNPSLYDIYIIEKDSYHIVTFALHDYLYDLGVKYVSFVLDENENNLSFVKASFSFSSRHLFVEKMFDKSIELLNKDQIFVDVQIEDYTNNLLNLIKKTEKNYA